MNKRTKIIIICSAVLALAVILTAVLVYTKPFTGKKTATAAIATPTAAETTTPSPSPTAAPTEAPTATVQAATPTAAVTETPAPTESPTPTPQPQASGITVGIDPGHQGSWVDMSAQEPDGPGSSTTKARCTTGTSGVYSGVPEYQLNLDVSFKLKQELENRGYSVVMTRTDNDANISNSERALLAADAGCDIYVRIHANGSENNSVSGALTMCPGADNPYVAHLYADSYRLSEAILNSYCAATGFGNLGVQAYNNMTGINWSQIPVTIVEMGFMSNEHDDLTMVNDSFQYTMSNGIANGIDTYFNITR
ncbi:MAG: N-acetylmuramoyl-L-alanine amidase [Lachnospiraceae bacterium]